MKPTDPTLGSSGPSFRPPIQAGIDSIIGHEHLATGNHRSKEIMRDMNVGTAWTAHGMKLRTL